MDLNLHEVFQPTASRDTNRQPPQALSLPGLGNVSGQSETDLGSHVC